MLFASLHMGSGLAVKAVMQREPGHVLCLATAAVGDLAWYVRERAKSRQSRN